VCGDLVNTVAVAHATASVGGGAVRSLTNRATQVYRREAGDR
jgi:hypothetical protein